MTNKPVKTDSNPLQGLYKKFIVPCCVYFSLTIFLTTLFYTLVFGSGSALDVKILLWYWLFSMAMSALGLVFEIKSLVKPLKVLFHWLGMVVLLIIVLVAAGSETVSTTTGAVLVVGASVLYFVFAGIYLLAKKLIPVKAMEYISKVFVYFSFALFLSEILTYAVEVADSAPTLINQLWFFIFAILAAAAEYIYRAKSGIFFRVLIHYLVFMLLIVVFFFVLAHAFVEYLEILLSVVVMTVVYFFITALVLMISGGLRKTENAEEKYKQQFNK